MRNCTSWPKGLRALWTKSGFYKIYILREVKTLWEKMPLSSLLTIPFGEVAASDVRRLHRRNRMARDLWNHSHSVGKFLAPKFADHRRPFRCDVAELPLGTPSSRNPIKSCSTKKCCLPSRNQRFQLPVDEKEISPPCCFKIFRTTAFGTEPTIWADFGSNWPC